MAIKEVTAEVGEQNKRKEVNNVMFISKNNEEQKVSSESKK